jgi:hypothetical protein
MRAAPLTAEQALASLKKDLGNAGIAAMFADDLTPQAVSQWRRIPHKRLRVISEKTGIAAKDLRPDLAEALAA